MRSDDLGRLRRFGGDFALLGLVDPLLKVKGNRGLNSDETAALLMPISYREEVQNNISEYVRHPI